MSCVEVEPQDRPSMPEVLAKLGIIEDEILQALKEDQQEHVGSIKILKQRRFHKRLSKPTPIDTSGRRVEQNKDQVRSSTSHPEDLDYDSEEERVNMEMHGRKGAVNDPDSKCTTWRTARWADTGDRERETVMDLFADTASKSATRLSKSHLVCSHYPTCHIQAATKRQMMM